jgi:hypothetical protein
MLFIDPGRMIRLCFIDEHTAYQPVRLSEAGPDGQQHALTAEPRVTYHFLENSMNIKNIFAALAIFTAAGSALAQQTEFVAPDAGFQSSLTRAEVRQDLAQAATEGKLARQRHDGQDAVYAAGSRSRQEVRAEAVQSAQTRRAGDVNNLYFGA